MKNDREIELIESPEDLIKNIKIDLIYKNQEPALLDNKFELIEGKLIKISLLSSSKEKSNTEINKYIKYIKTRHSDNMERHISNIEININQLNNEIRSINEIYFFC